MIKKSSIICAILCIPILVFSWGMWGHQHINRAAIFTLPEPLRSFYFRHADYITEESVVPDVRKYTMGDKAEFARHFIDMEDYHFSSDTFEMNPKKAYTQYDEKTRNELGILPWYILEMTQKLTEAFKNKEKAAILLLSGDLGHYIGDACMPLHTTSNHNGQKTGQQGIHAFWESQLPEIFGSTYQMNIGEAHHIKDLEKNTRELILQSHSLVDSVLLIDKILGLKFSKETAYQCDTNKNPLKNIYGNPIHSKSYAEAYHQASNHLIERQLQKAAYMLSCYWYTAWCNAGKPELNDLDSQSYIESCRENYTKEQLLWKTGKTIEIGNKKEF